MWSRKLSAVKILVIGSGAREHAILHSLAGERNAQGDKPAHELHAAPGNPGIAELATLHMVNPLDAIAVSALALEVGAELVVVGPEAPLVAGAGDAVRAVGIPVFGPNSGPAALEGSKAFAKDVMSAAGVPTARAHVCTNLDEIAAAIDDFGAPYVIKDDGLAAGKGVVVTQDRAEALEHARLCFENPNGPGRIVVEEFLDGPEVSLFCISDGTDVVPLAPAQDFKRAYDDDAGPNTGGMGAYSPLPWAPEDLTERVLTEVARPTIAEMARRGKHFRGVLYVGLALTSAGPRVIEFNARFGDPETQVVLSRLATPLSQVLWASALGTIADLPALQWHERAAVTVVVAAQNYPDVPRSGDPITGIDAAEELAGLHVLHAGTRSDDDGTLRSSGGRVLSVVGVGDDLRAARDSAYQGVALIDLPGSHHRSDIASVVVATATAAAGAETSEVADAEVPAG